MKKFIFDFDGVICDSTPECFVTSNNAWNEINKKKIKKLNYSIFVDSKIYKRFSKFRPFIKGGGEYFIFYYMEENKIKQNYQNYLLLKKKLIKNINNYSKFFYKERNNLKKNNLKKWIKLNYIFPDVLKLIRKLNNNNQLLISTMKDKKSILSLLRDKNLNIDEDKILDQFEIKNKLESIKLFMKRFKINKSDIYFFDDNINHILNPKKDGFNVYLTTWGYSTREFKQIAKKNKITVLNNIKMFNFF